MIVFNKVRPVTQVTVMEGAKAYSRDMNKFHRFSLAGRSALAAGWFGLLASAGVMAQSQSTPGQSAGDGMDGAATVAPATPGASGIAQSSLSKRAIIKANANKPVTTAKPTKAVKSARPRMGLSVPLTAKSPTEPSGKDLGKGGDQKLKLASATNSPYKNKNVNGTDKAQKFYANVWGVDKLRASYTNSGNLIKFTYRVLQPKLAAPLGDHASTPEMIGIRSNAVLHVPTMEKIGELRQKSAAESNRDYWMVFSNKGNLVKPGDEVSVVIGKFHADGLIVE
jgi:hypothetical protein